MVFAADITAFHVMGAVLVFWAVLLSVLGITRHNFPPSDVAEKIVIAISGLLVAGTIGAGIATSESPAKAEGGGEAPAATGGAIDQLKISADPSGALKFDKSTLQAKEGRVKITMSNPSPLSHNVSIEGSGVDVEGKTVPKGGTSDVAAALQPGTYTYYCSVPGHREAGMEGTLTVK